MNIAEEVARKRASGVSPAIERRFIREIGEPFTPTFNPIEADPLADYVLPFIYRGGIWRLICSLSLYQTRGAADP
jgi:hypothetical protein